MAWWGRLWEVNTEKGWPGEHKRHPKRILKLWNKFKKCLIAFKCTNSKLKGLCHYFPHKSKQLTVNVPVKGHHACPLRTAKRGVMQLIRQGRGYPGLGMTLGSPAVLGRVLFMSCSAVLKPHLWRRNVHHVATFLQKHMLIYFTKNIFAKS